MSGAPATPRFLPSGETAIAVEYGCAIDPLIHDHVLALDAAIAAAPIEGIVETVPTYRSLMVHFDPRATTPEALIEKLLKASTTSSRAEGVVKRWRIPVCYDASLAEDLAEVADSLHLPPERIAGLHAQAHYRVYMYGFAPGFTFLGGLPDELAISRRPAPRPPAPPGSLLIAGGQALITTIAMPTGWYVIGQTPARMFDPARGQPFLVNAGDEIRFESIDLGHFKRLQSDAAHGAMIARDETA